MSFLGLTFSGRSPFDRSLLLLLNPSLSLPTPRFVPVWTHRSSHPER